MSDMPATRGPLPAISVFGLGYVGCTSACCWASVGYRVIGVDTNPDKVASFMAGEPLISEPGIAELLREGLSERRLCATDDVAQAVGASDLSCICVGTPSDPAGHVNTEFLRRVSEAIGQALRGKSGYHVVMVRSTIPPGTTRQLVLTALEAASGRKVGRDFGLVFNPEFLREGSAVADFHHPSRTVIGQYDDRSGDAAATLYDFVQAPTRTTSLETAEMIKFADNAFHAAKVAFTNEIGQLSRSLGVDAQEVMEVFRLDTKLNLGPAYLRPGSPFGGSCLPKDLRALLNLTRKLHVGSPLLEAVLTSNDRYKSAILSIVTHLDPQRVAVLGLSFKTATDDLRESPAVELVESMIGRGYEVTVFDPDVNPGRLVGSNLAYARRLPHIARLMANSLATSVHQADVIVLTKLHPDFEGVPSYMSNTQILVDMAGWPDGRRILGSRYIGTAW